MDYMVRGALELEKILQRKSKKQIQKITNIVL